MVRQVSLLNYIAVGPGSNLDGGVGQDIFYSMLFSYVSDGTLCRRSSDLKTLTFAIVKNNYRFEMINAFYSNSLLYHSSVFFINSLSEAVYLCSFCGMCDCNIFIFVFNKHTYTHSLGCSSSSLLFICMLYHVKHECM